LARFKGNVQKRNDSFVPVALIAVLIVVAILVIWYVVDRVGFMIYWNSLTASLHR